MTVRTPVLCGAIFVVVAMGCGDSTASQPFSLVKHVDALYVDASTRGSAGSPAYRYRAGSLSNVEIPIAYGAVPVRIDVTTANGIERWSGVEFKSPPNHIPDDGYATWIDVYRGNEMHTLLVAYFRSDGALRASELLVNDTLALDPSDAFGVTIDSTSGADCEVASGLQNPDVARFFSSPCTLETFRTAFSGDFSVPTNVDPSLRSLSFDYTTISGVRTGAR